MLGQSDAMNRGEDAAIGCHNILIDNRLEFPVQLAESLHIFIMVIKGLFNGIAVSVLFAFSQLAYPEY
jgi:hypothetical protein